MKIYRRFSSVFLGIIFLSISCVKRFEEPKNLLSKREMKDLLIEITLSKNIPPELFDTLVRNNKNKADERVLKILKNHAVTLKQFKESHYYYTLYPEEYKMIFKMVKDSLQTELKHLKIEDSLASLEKEKAELEASKKTKKKSTVDIKKEDEQKKDSIMQPIHQKLDSLRKIQKKQ